ncbi:DUF1272 domain-containing protein [Bizionia paragorgiae]|uniref:Uncharacterized protein n=1 Tax=Bizionia paragorgiae TaxID=283786 RepID=A0A1H4CJ68_BIZPA|nr:DUF1272 domain-containing protein [Bizionia paragorgiae]SEA60407.1 hypothetical protein SAMN04487990_12021 [Bizionia paragorgiae]
MLEIRLHCENCDKHLPNDTDNAMICSYECTFCKDCVDTVLKNVCPNCGGGFEKRPTRPKSQLKKNPPRKDNVLKPNIENVFLKENRTIDPRKR